MALLDTINVMAETPSGVFQLAVVVVICLCAFAIFLSVLINFIDARQRPRPKIEKRSIVATGTMTAFFVVFYLLIRLKVGEIPLDYIPVKIGLVLSGLALVVIGCVVNIQGRVALGANWADHIKIYPDHTLVGTGVFRFVRHPLYASLIWMFYGACLVYCNGAAFLANTLVFIPFMAYRAKQEEDLLAGQFPAYRDYQKKVGMFFPRLIPWRTKSCIPQN